jgi:hypothetical protein
MTDDRDPLLTRLFAEQGPPESGSEFESGIRASMERDLRNARAYRISMIVGAVVIALLLAPWIAQACALGIGSVIAAVNTTRALSSFPLAWLVVGSVVIGFAPVIYLGITRRW